MNAVHQGDPTDAMLPTEVGTVHPMCKYIWYFPCCTCIMLLFLLARNFFMLEYFGSNVQNSNFAQKFAKLSLFAKT